MTDPQDRLENSIKSPYDPEGELLSALLEAFAAEFEEHEAALDSIERAKFIDDAEAPHLEKLASIFEMEREGDEALDDFRARLKAGLRSQITSATVEEVAEVASVILDQDRSQIEIVEPFELEPAFIQIDAEVTIDASRFIDIIELVTAAGVGVGIRLTEDLSDTLAIEDSVLVGPQEGLIGREGFGLADDSLVDPPNGMIGDDEVGISDTAEVEDPILESESAAISDSEHHHIDTPQQTFWGDGRWGIDHYDEVLVRFSMTESDTLAMSATGFVDSQVIHSETLAMSDSVSLEFEAVQNLYWGEAAWGKETHVW